jgi:hypothetical protein
VASDVKPCRSRGQQPCHSSRPAMRPVGLSGADAQELGHDQMLSGTLCHRGYNRSRGRSSQWHRAGEQRTLVYLVEGFGHDGAPSRLRSMTVCAKRMAHAAAETRHLCHVIERNETVPAREPPALPRAAGREAPLWDNCQARPPQQCVSTNAASRVSAHRGID